MIPAEPEIIKTNPETADVKVVPGRCYECHVQCAMFVHVHDGKVVRLEGDPKFVNQGALCAKGLATLRNLYHPERLDYPLMRTRPKGDADPGWVRITWDEALDRIAARLKQVQTDHGGYAIAIGQGTGRYTVAQHFRLKNCLGSPNTLTPSHVCRGPMSATTTLSVGHHLRGDYPRSACQVYWGRNEPWAHPAFTTRMVMDNIMERGSKVIVVDPRYEHPLAHKADVYLPVRPGSDGALMLSWIHVILEEGLYDEGFVSRWTDGPALVWTDTLELLKESDVRTGGDDRDFLPYPESVADRRNRRPLVVWDAKDDAPRPAASEGAKPALFGTYEAGGRECKTVLQLLRERAALYPPEKAAGICWTGSAEKIREAARLYATSPSACMDVGSFGIQGLEGGHTNSFDILRTHFCLAALTGNINRPGGEIGTPHWRWIKGDWKREGGPRAMTPWGAPDDDFECLLEGPHPEEPALDEYPLQPGLTSMIDGFRAMKTGRPYPIKAYVMVQGNPLGGWCEDQKTVREGLLALDFLVDMDLYITPTNSLADIVLPAALGPFERGPDRCVEPLYERWTDEKFYVELGHRLDPKMWPWASVEEWSEWAAAAHGRNLADAAKAGFAVERGQVAPPLDFYKETDPATGDPVGFATPTGRLEIYSVIALQHGVDPLPGYTEPAQSPYSTPGLATEYPLVLTTGARLPVFYHSQHRNNPLQRELFPHPQAEIDKDTAAKHQVSDGDWIWIETITGKIRMQAKVTAGILPGVVSMAHGWWQGCTELGLPGYGWDGANANVLISGNEHDPALGVPGTRSQLCKLYRAEEPPFVWEPPYYGTTKPPGTLKPPGTPKPLDAAPEAIRGPNEREVGP
jgi:anaerobic selenocysteine-containing dehydrogenase